MTELAPDDAVSLDGPEQPKPKPKPKVEKFGGGWRVALYVGDVVAGTSGVFETKAAAQRAARDIG